MVKPAMSIFSTVETSATMIKGDVPITEIKSFVLNIASQLILPETPVKSLFSLVFIINETLVIMAFSKLDVNNITVTTIIPRTPPGSPSDCKDIDQVPLNLFLPKLLDRLNEVNDKDRKLVGILVSQNTTVLARYSVVY